MLVSKARLLHAEGQPDSIVEEIENMVRSYVEKVLIKSFSASDVCFYPILWQSSREW